MSGAQSTLGDENRALLARGTTQDAKKNPSQGGMFTYNLHHNPVPQNGPPTKKFTLTGRTEKGRLAGNDLPVI